MPCRRSGTPGKESACAGGFVSPRSEFHKKPQYPKSQTLNGVVSPSSEFHTIGAQTCLRPGVASSTMLSSYCAGRPAGVPTGCFCGARGRVCSRELPSTSTLALLDPQRGLTWAGRWSATTPKPVYYAHRCCAHATWKRRVRAIVASVRCGLRGRHGDRWRRCRVPAAFVSELSAVCATRVSLQLCLCLPT